MNYVNIGIVSLSFVVALVALFQSTKLAMKGWRWLSDDGQHKGGAIFVLFLLFIAVATVPLLSYGRKRREQEHQKFFGTIEQNGGAYKVLQISSDLKTAFVEGTKNSDRLQVETNGHAPQVGEVWQVCFYEAMSGQRIYRISGRW